jgi:hypothetical protein
MDLEAYELILEVLSQSHDYGESIADKIELWIGTSFGLIIMAYFAPDRLRPGTAAIVIGIYVAFTAWIFSNIGADIELSEAALEDAKALAEQYQIDSKALQYRLGDGGTGSGTAFAIFMLGLFTTAVGYVAYTARESFQRGKQDRA